VLRRASLDQNNIKRLGKNRRKREKGSGQNAIRKKNSPSESLHACYRREGSPAGCKVCEPTSPTGSEKARKAKGGGGNTVDFFVSRNLI